MKECNQCQNERYVILGCCSGRECGCMGQEVSMANCKECNPLAAIPPSEQLMKEYGHLEYVGTENKQNSQ